MACVLARNDYHKICDALGGVGYSIDGNTPDVDSVFHEARKIASGPNGRPVLINAMIGRTDFREGSISV